MSGGMQRDYRWLDPEKTTFLKQYTGCLDEGRHRARCHWVAALLLLALVGGAVLGYVWLMAYTAPAPGHPRSPTIPEEEGGARRPDAPKAPAAGGPASPPACGWPGTQCLDLKCCNMQHQHCFSKNEFWASCGHTCTPGVHEGNPDGEPWNCSVLGHARAPGVARAAPAGTIAGTSLYCISVVSARDNSIEVDLMVQHRLRYTGIFACDESKIFRAPVLAKTVEWGSFSNTGVFLDIWRQVLGVRRYLEHDWTVKVDPDAVFLPHRLRQHLVKLSPPANTSLYLKNCDFKFGFMGALEIFSTGALEAFRQKGDDCSKYYGVNGGEDFWMMQCMDSLGVPHMTDATLLNDKYTLPGNYDIHDESPCLDPAAVAYHPYKWVDTWVKCFENTRV